MLAHGYSSLTNVAILRLSPLAPQYARASTHACNIHNWIGSDNLSRRLGGSSMANRICFVELPTTTLGPAKSFYADVFGFAMSDFGPSYSCTLTGDVDLGLQADADEVTGAALPVIQVDSLETIEALVKRSGGIITKPTFSFPGGRRFHFRDPAGNELAAMQPT
jgi:hypothetical protein